MKIERILVVNSKRNVKLAVLQPKLKQDEIAIGIEINIPDAFFRRPKLDVKVDIPEDQAPIIDITGELIGNMKKVVKENLNLDLSVNIVEHKEDS